MESIDNKEKKILAIDELAIRLRRDIMDLALVAGASSAHIGGALSIVEITATLFAGIMNYDPKRPNWGGRDRYILSKGHACLAYYAALSEAGYFEKEEFSTFEKTGSRLLGHPVMDRSIGIEFSNGSLGMGLGLGIGVAIAGKKRNRGYRVYVILGDGECNEGAVWEAAMAAAHFGLDNLVVIVDKNRFQQTGSNVDVMNVDNLRDKWEGFGWESVEVDGHNNSAIFDTLTVGGKFKKPLAVIANTIKGKGISFTQNDNEWHHAVMTKKLHEAAVSEVCSGSVEKK